MRRARVSSGSEAIRKGLEDTATHRPIARYDSDEMPSAFTARAVER
jgi:hypothetical protein